jgi:Na+/H+ antiporter NhaB
MLKSDVMRITTVSVAVSVSVRYYCTLGCDKVWFVFNKECPHRASNILRKMAGDYNQKLQQQQQKM